MHKKKMIAPVVISVLLILYYIGLAFVLTIMEGMPLAVKLPAIIVPLLLAGVCIFVLVERIKEIRSGEEDDLSDY